MYSRVETSSVPLPVRRCPTQHAANREGRVAAAGPREEGRNSPRLIITSVQIVALVGVPVVPVVPFCACVIVVVVEVAVD